MGTAEYMRVWIDDANAGMWPGWSLASAWFPSGESFWAWFRREEHDHG